MLIKFFSSSMSKLCKGKKIMHTVTSIYFGGGGKKHQREQMAIPDWKPPTSNFAKRKRAHCTVEREEKCLE